jgi:hypothetical protein
MCAAQRLFVPGASHPSPASRLTPLPPPLPLKHPTTPQLLLSKILEAFVAKLGSLRSDIPALLEVRRGGARQRGGS